MQAGAGGWTARERRDADDLRMESGDLGRCDEWMHCVQCPNPIHQVGALFYERDSQVLRSVRLPVVRCAVPMIVSRIPTTNKLGEGKERKEMDSFREIRLDWLQSGWRFRFSSQFSWRIEAKWLETARFQFRGWFLGLGTVRSNYRYTRQCISCHSVTLR